MLFLLIFKMSAVNITIHLHSSWFSILFLFKISQGWGDSSMSYLNPKNHMVLLSTSENSSLSTTKMPSSPQKTILNKTEKYK